MIIRAVAVLVVTLSSSFLFLQHADADSAPQTPQKLLSAFPNCLQDMYEGAQKTGIPAENPDVAQELANHCACREAVFEKAAQRIDSADAHVQQTLKNIGIMIALETTGRRSDREVQLFLQHQPQKEIFKKHGREYSRHVTELEYDCTSTFKKRLYQALNKGES